MCNRFELIAHAIRCLMQFDRHEMLEALCEFEAEQIEEEKKLEQALKNSKTVNSKIWITARELHQAVKAEDPDLLFCKCNALLLTDYRAPRHCSFSPLQ